MNREKTEHHLDGLMALILFGVFAVCLLIVLFTGAATYRRLTERDQRAYDRRTCTQYLAARVTGADTLNTVTVEEFGGTQALVLTDGEGYLTRIYYYDGYLMELYAAAGEALQPEDGEKTVAAGGLQLSLDEGLLTATVVSTEGDTSTLHLALRSGEGDGR